MFGKLRRLLNLDSLEEKIEIYENYNKEISLVKGEVKEIALDQQFEEATTNKKLAQLNSLSSLSQEEKDLLKGKINAKYNHSYNEYLDLLKAKQDKISDLEKKLDVLKSNSPELISAISEIERRERNQEKLEFQEKLNIIMKGHQEGAISDNIFNKVQNQLQQPYYQKLIKEIREDEILEKASKSKPKLDRNTVSYVYNSTGNTCGDCGWFKGPNSCSLIRGKISSSAWCKLYGTATAQMEEIKTNIDEKELLEEAIKETEKNEEVENISSSEFKENDEKIIQEAIKEVVEEEEESEKSLTQEDIEEIEGIAEEVVEEETPPIVEEVVNEESFFEELLAEIYKILEEKGAEPVHFEKNFEKAIKVELKKATPKEEISEKIANILIIDPSYYSKET